MSAHSKDLSQDPFFYNPNTRCIIRDFLVQNLADGSLAESKVIESTKKAIKYILEEFEEKYLKDNQNLSIISIDTTKLTPLKHNSYVKGIVALRFIDVSLLEESLLEEDEEEDEEFKLDFCDPTPSGSKNTVGDPQEGYRDSDDPQGESPELEDELNEDLGTCDWDGPEECESCQ